MRALYTAATGMAAQELNVQVISNNIANVRTNGFKRQRAQFQGYVVRAQLEGLSSVSPVEKVTARPGTIVEIACL